MLRAHVEAVGNSTPSLKWMDGVLSPKPNRGTESHPVRKTIESHPVKLGNPCLFSEEIKQTLNTYTHVHTYTPADLIQWKFLKLIVLSPLLSYSN